jgi:hypothetical protein
MSFLFWAKKHFTNEQITFCIQLANFLISTKLGNMKLLPIGIQTFRKIIEGNYLYIDKTKFIYEMVKNPSGFFFLSRPRRFGKSLLLSTLNEIFLGNKEIFKGLSIYDSSYEWKKYPIIRIDFSKQKAENKEQLERFINTQLDSIAIDYGVSLKPNEYFSRFEELIHKLKDFGKIVILIDEYDKPIIDYIEQPELAKEMREILKGFYTIIKASDEHIRFVLLTGVSKFSRTGIFSGLNNLNDISMNQNFSAMLGITETELKENFKEYILEFSNVEKISEEALLDKIRFWYNGYCFTGDCEKVYNPFSTLLLFYNKNFSNYWFESGTPTFLINLAKKNDFTIESIPLEIGELSFSTYDIEKLQLVPLLFQTGYLTLKGYDKESMLYSLDYPNFEVKNAFLTYLAAEWTKKEAPETYIHKLITSLRSRDFELFFQILQSLFANIDYDLHINQEKYYQTIFYLVFTLIGLKVFAEVKTNIGRIDVVIDDKDLFLFEFKLNDTATNALKQIHKNKYFQKYLASDYPLGNKKLFLFGVEFKNKNIGEWVLEEK